MSEWRTNILTICDARIAAWHALEGWGDTGSSQDWDYGARLVKAEYLAQWIMWGQKADAPPAETAPPPSEGSG